MGSSAYLDLNPIFTRSYMVNYRATNVVYVNRKGVAPLYRLVTPLQWISFLKACTRF